MQSKIFKQAFDELEQLSYQNDSVLVSYSGGKDSRIVLDLCTQVFKKVVCFFMYFLPNLDCVKEGLEFAKLRYGVPVLEYPHWIMFRYLKYGIYCDELPEYKNIPDLLPRDMHDLIRQDTGIQLIVTGMKLSDSASRASDMTYSMLHNPYLVHPIRKWKKWEVLAYLKFKNIPLPHQRQGNMTGIDLTDESLYFLYDNYPQDFEKVIKVFPYAETAIYRRLWYGKKGDKNGK